MKQPGTLCITFALVPARKSLGWSWWHQPCSLHQKLLVSGNLQPCGFALACEILPAGRLVMSCWTLSVQGTAASGEGIWLWYSLFSSPLVLALIQTLSRTAQRHSLYDTLPFWGLFCPGPILLLLTGSQLLAFSSPQVSPAPVQAAQPLRDAKL